jgi:hypothetical protein
VPGANTITFTEINAQGATKTDIHTIAIAIYAKLHTVYHINLALVDIWEVFAS